jgi:hypothetical protein
VELQKRHRFGIYTNTMLQCDFNICDRNIYFQMQKPKLLVTILYFIISINQGTIYKLNLFLEDDRWHYHSIVIVDL